MKFQKLNSRHNDNLNDPLLNILFRFYKLQLTVKDDFILDADYVA